MKIKCTDLNFKEYDVYLGGDKFKKKFPYARLIEANEEEGIVLYMPDEGNSKYIKTDRNHKVYIVRTV